MKKFISKVQNLSQKAAELKAAMQQVPPKVAEIREAVTATAGQLAQLKSEIQYSVADLKADHEDDLSQALQEINNSADVFTKAGFALEGVDIEISPVQRLLVHLVRIGDVATPALRSLLHANEQRRTTRAILSSLLQAKQMAETVELDDLIYNEVIVGIGPIPSVRLCWQPEVVEPSQVAHATAAIPVSPPLAASAPPSAPMSPFGAGSFFERREPTPALVATPVASAASTPVPTVGTHSTVLPKPEAATPSSDPLARFKKMPILTR